MAKNPSSKLVIRNASMKDVKEIHKLSIKTYKEMPPYSLDIIRAQINNFPEGHFVAVYEGKIVGYCSTIRVPEKLALGHHSWKEVTGGGYGSTHDPKGTYLYGIDIFVDSDYRGLKIGERFYRERKKLCKYYRLKGIVFAGRMPLLSKRIKKVGTVENYIEQVKNKKIRDPVISFQIRNGFEIIGILKGYLPIDRESLGYAAHMLWKNPEYADSPVSSALSPSRIPQSVRVATVQYLQRRINSLDEFNQIFRYFVDVASDYHCDFVLFPELFTMQLLSIENEPLSPHESIERLTNYTDTLKTFFSEMAIKYNVNIIAGSHPVKIEEEVKNISFICLRDGSIYEQMKIHATPNEKYWWNISGGEKLSVIETDCGNIGVLICYDIQFPELARHLVDQGANILFVPYMTEERQGYNRIRYCAQARAIENQCYVIMSGNVGNLPRVHNMDINYAQSCIITPCDFPFARDGIASDTTPNVETIAISDISLQNLFESRNAGTVQNLKDRRHDLYSVTWNKKD
ncbi:MAG: GNAT family N-acetyltransferase [Candidatus Methanofastidiosum sp.]|nr:GNAT family N-acetyltransferase [Methanofastidiosum sp.]